MTWTSSNWIFITSTAAWNEKTNGQAQATMEDTLTTKKRKKEKDREFHESLENKARTKSSKTIFLGVYALTRPGKTEANRRSASGFVVPFPRGSGDAQPDGVVENSSDRATGSVRKRKRTPSDGSSSQSSGVSEDML